MMVAYDNALEHVSLSDKFGNVCDGRYTSVFKNATLVSLFVQCANLFTKCYYHRGFIRCIKFL